MTKLVRLSHEASIACTMAQLGAGVNARGRLVEDQDGGVARACARAMVSSWRLALGDVLGIVAEAWCRSPAGSVRTKKSHVRGSWPAGSISSRGRVRACRRRCSPRWCPRSSHASCSTMPKRLRSSARAHGRAMSTPVERDAAAIDLVEAHEQVDERRLAGAAWRPRWRPSAPARPRADVAHERAVRRRSQSARARRPRALARLGQPAGMVRVGARPPASSSNAKTRSAAARALCSVFDREGELRERLRSAADVLEERLDNAHGDALPP